MFWSLSFIGMIKGYLLSTKAELNPGKDLPTMV